TMIAFWIISYKYLISIVGYQLIILLLPFVLFILIWIPKLTGIEKEPPKFSKVIFHFNNGFNLAYISIRMFGKVSVANSIEEYLERKKLGPDAYKMTLQEFQEAVRRRKAIAKNALLNQSFIAGVGNIYSDEILFRTKIHPKNFSYFLS
ncbi:unnamed protein product, partial [marine sediment metagenome]